MFIGNLDYSVDNFKLRKFIEQNNLRPLDVFIPLDQDRKPKGFGYARFSNEQDALAAKNQLNGQRFEGKALRIDYSNGRK